MNAAIYSRLRALLNTVNSSGLAVGICAFLMLALVIWLVYFPSLGHIPRSDQWCVFYDTLDDHGFVEILQTTYSYNRTRACAPGDVYLFRPVLFTLLSAEQSIFGHHFVWWQVFGIQLHVVTSYLTYCLMCQFYSFTKPDPEHMNSGHIRVLAFVLTLFFATNPAIMYLVIWSHINGYLLFFVFALGAFLGSLKYISAPHEDGKTWRLVAIWIIAFLAAFTYEVGLVLAVLLAFLHGIYARGRRLGLKRFAVFVAIPVFYMTVSGVDYAYHSSKPHFYRIPYVGADVTLDRVFETQTLTQTRKFLVYSVLQPFFPSALEIDSRDRLYIDEGIRWRASDPILALSLLVLGVWLVSFVLGLLSLRRRSGFVIVIFLVGLLAGYTAINVLGRLNLRPGSLPSNSYYSYMAMNLFILLSFALWINLPVLQMWLVSATLPFLLAVMVVLTAGAARTYTVNRMLADEFAVMRNQVGEIETFIETHEDEPGFSIAPDFHNHSTNIWLGVPQSYILFHDYIDPYTPQYVFWVEGGRTVFQDGEVFRAAHGLDPNQFFPELLDLRHPYFIYFYQQQYWALDLREGYFNPARVNDYGTLFVDTTREAINDKVTRATVQQYGSR